MCILQCVSFQCLSMLVFLLEICFQVPGLLRGTVGLLDWSLLECCVDTVQVIVGTGQLNKLRLIVISCYNESEVRSDSLKNSLRCKHCCSTFYSTMWPFMMLEQNKHLRNGLIDGTVFLSWSYLLTVRTLALIRCFWFCLWWNSDSSWLKLNKDDDLV